jgi:HEAT repeat protein
MADSVAEQIAALQDDDWAIREEAAVALGAFRDPRAVGPLVGLLRDSDRAVREAAISALTAIGGPSVPVLGLCLSDPQLGVQEAASSVLASIADERVIDPLIGALANSDWIVRMHATKALGRIKAAGAIDPLIPLLQDKVKAVREEATVALAKIGDAALSSLLDALKHPEWLVRLHAVEALARMRSPRAVEPLLWVLFNDTDQAIREDVIRALGQIGDSRATEFLVTAMKEPRLRTLAVEALGQIGDRSAVPLLVAVLEGADRLEGLRPVAGCGDRWDEEMVTKGAAVRALGSIGDDTAIPALLKALDQTETRADAAAALVKFGSKVIAPLLTIMTQSSDENVRFHVKDTLAQVGWRAGRI